MIVSQDCIIADCGELQPGEGDGIVDNEGLGDVYPGFPDDSDLDFSEVWTRNDLVTIFKLYV